MGNPFSTAAEALPGHWWKGGYTDGDSNHCTAGHVALACGATVYDLENNDVDNYLNDFLTDILNKAASQEFPGRGGLIADINDHEDTTEADALAILNKAAVLYEKLTPAGLV